MADCRWLTPVLVAQFESLERTGEHHLRHTKFIGLRDDKLARDVRREEAAHPLARSGWPIVTFAEPARR